MIDKSVLNNFSEMLIYSKFNISKFHSDKIDSVYEALVDIEHASKHHKTYSEEQWRDLLNKYRNNLDFLVALAYKTDIPTPFIQDIILDIKSRTTHYSLRSDDAFFLKMLLTKDFNQDIFDSITSSLPINMICHAIVRNNSFYNGITFNFNQQYIDKIGEIAFNIYRPNSKTQPTFLPPHHQILSMVSRDLFHKLAPLVFDGGVSSQTVTALLSNKNLDENNVDDKNLAEALTDYFDPLYFSEIPQIISSTLTKSLHESVILKHIDTPFYFSEKNDEIEKVALLLKDATQKERLSDAVEYDLCTRILAMKSRREDKIAQAIFPYIKNPQFISRIDELMDNNKITTYLNNSNIPEEMLKKKAAEYCKKIKKYLNKKDTDYPNDWNIYLTNFLKRATLDAEDYELLISTEKRDILLSIASSPKTPDYILDKLIKYSADTIHHEEILSKAIITAHINKFCNENNASNEFRRALFDSTNSEIHFSKKLYDKENYNKKFDAYFLALNLKSDIGAFISEQTLEKAISIDMDMSSKFSSFLKTLIDDPTLSKERLYIERATTCIDETIKFRKSIKYQDNDLSNSVLAPYQKFIYKAYEYDAYPFMYIELPEILEKFQEYTDLINEAVKEIETTSQQPSNTVNKPPQNQEFDER